MNVLLLFDVSGGELLVVLLFVLLFFGSKGIPGVARTMGKAMRQIRDASAEVQREIQRGANEVRDGFEEQKRQVFEPPERSIPSGTGPAPAPPVRETPAPPAPAGEPAAPTQATPEP